MWIVDRVDSPDERKVAVGVNILLQCVCYTIIIDDFLRFWFDLSMNHGARQVS